MRKFFRKTLANLKIFNNFASKQGVKDYYMHNEFTAKHPADTYIWDDGYQRPTEQERICTFVCSCIESAAERLNGKASDIYRRMERVGLITEYIIPCYDTLHSESRENVTKDVIETLEYWEKKKGICR